MPASTASLESLSSPSPSPPPPEEHHSNHSGAAGLDSGSELSELTEDEQDNDTRTNEDDASRTSTRKKQKRDRIVPAPMWDWAYKQKKSEKKDKSDWRNKPVEEEEEEEEQAGPAKAMEEEEDDDQDKDSNPDGDDDSPRKSRAPSDDVDDNDNDEEEQPEEDGESVDEAPASRRIRKGTSGDVSAEEEDDMEDPEPDAPDADADRTPKAASPDLTDDENDNLGEDEVDEDDQAEVVEAPKDGSDAEDEEEDPEAVADDGDALDADEPPTTEAVTPAEGVVDPVEVDMDTTMDVDAPPAVLMSPVAVAASSIMAGASLIQPESPSSSQPSTPSVSRMSSRYPSVEPEQGPDVPSEPEAEPEPERKPSSGRAPRQRKGKARTRAARRSRAAAAAEAGEAEADADQVDGAEGDNVDADDMDVATPDLDLDSDMQPAHRAEALDVLAAIELKFALLRERLYVEKMDTLAWEEGLIADGTHPELLHLHAELSKRRDKRLELASRRRDYEVANVTKRRRLDEEGVWSWWKDARDELQTDMISETNSKRRRLERERRALERPQPTRRFPLPPAEVPPAPSLREIVKSSPFGIPEAALPQSKRYLRKREPPPPNTLIYPHINSLSHGEIMQDLDLFFQHRRAAASFDPHRGGPGLMNSVLGGMPPPDMDPYVMGMQVLDGPAGNRFGPPFHQSHLQPGLVQGFGAPPPRFPHHHSAPPGSLPHLGHSQMQLEREIAMSMRAPSGMPQHPSHLHQQQFGAGPGPSTLMRRSISPVPHSNGAGPSGGMPTSMGGGPLPPGVPGPKPNGWTGPPAGVHMNNKDARINGDIEGRERERDRQGDGSSQRERERARDLEREREAERAYHMAHGQSRHPTHQHTHQHAHTAAPGQSAHGPHHHVHHHHHVRHHHHPPHQTLSGPGGTPNVAPMAGLPPGPSGGPSPSGQTLSPHGSRDLSDQRRPRSGAPTEIIELSAQKPPSGASPRMSTFWQANDEPLPPEMQRERERDRGSRALAGPSSHPPPPGPHERLVTPFTMGPSQPLQSGSRPSSPRGVPGSSNFPPSMPSSRRGSWSAANEETSYPRPPSSSHGPPPPGPQSQRPPSSRMAQQAGAPSFHSPFGSPPYSNGRQPPPPPASPPPSSFAGSIRSPGRSNQHGRIGPGAIGMPMSPPPAPMSHSPRLGASPGGPKMSSRGAQRPPSPRPSKALSKMEGFPMPESGNIAPIATGSGAMPPAGAGNPAPLLPPLPTTLPPAGPGVSRMPNGGGLSEKPPAHLPGGPPPSKVVPVDGPS
ncbi:hypothetical protein C8Q70DRAFT_1049589 [Cubamyces menziesii]|nr:hypothetical protein C8Q70DRAFT_1049589 [Cubamyces menziesii]